MDSKYEELLRRMEIEQQLSRQADNPFPPRHIFELSREHPIVHNLIERWHRGDLSWEQALSGMVVYLVEQNKKMQKLILEGAKFQSPAPVIVSPEMLEQIQRENP
jgi:cytochrome P450